MWAVTLGRLDITAYVMTMSRFRQAPRVGNLRQVKRIFGYLANLPQGTIKYRTNEPDYSNLPHKEYVWTRTGYAGAREELPHNLPKPLGRQVTSIHYVDAKLHHDLITGKAVTAILQMINANPVHWYCNRQLTGETATCGSEFVAARTAVDQIINLCFTLMYLGVPINPKSYMFGDNMTVVSKASIPISTLSKRSQLAAYPRV